LLHSLEIIPLTESLLSVAVDLDRLCFGQLWTRDGYQREINSPNSDLLVLRTKELQIPVADPCGNEVEPPHLSTQPFPPILGLGCLWAILEEAHITILAIHPSYRGQGLGQVLLYQLILSAWKRQLAWVTLEVRASNEAAIALYHKFGFQNVGRRRNYYQDTYYHNIGEHGQELDKDALILWNNHLKNSDFQETLRIWEPAVSDRLTRFNWSL